MLKDLLGEELDPSPTVDEAVRGILRVPEVHIVDVPLVDLETEDIKVYDVSISVDDEKVTGSREFSASRVRFAYTFNSLHPHSMGDAAVKSLPRVFSAGFIKGKMEDIVHR